MEKWKNGTGDLVLFSSKFFGKHLYALVECALPKDKATWPGIKRELCDLPKSMQYTNWRWIILNWHANLSLVVHFWGSFYCILVFITFCGSCYILEHNNGHFDFQVEEIQPLVVLSMVQKILSAM